MKKIALGMALSALLFSSCSIEMNSVEINSPTQESASISQSIKNAYTEALDCSQNSEDLYRNWCMVTKLGEAPFETPKESHSYLGFSMVFDPSQGIQTSSLDTTRLSVLHLKGDYAFITDISPSNDEEEASIADLSFTLAELLKENSIKPLTIDANLYDYIATEEAQDAYYYNFTLNEAGDAATYEAYLPTELFYVPDLGYVGIEDNGDGRAYVSVFSLAPLSK